MDIGLGRCKKTRINYYYREWTNGISGDASQPTQLNNLQRLVKHWSDLPGRNQRDVVTLGDANVCALSWDKPDYSTNLKELSDIFKQFFINESFSQLVSVFTRSQKMANGSISQSCIDHIATNVPDKCSVPIVTSAGSSDHLAVLITKYSRQLRQEPRTIKQRNYKNFNPTEFLTEIACTNFDRVKLCFDPDTAAALFSGIFGSVLNKYAPVKIYQTRNNYVPWLSQETKDLMNRRDKAKEDSTRTGDELKYEEYNKRVARADWSRPAI